jgi:hypothetical protein
MRSRKAVLAGGVMLAVGLAALAWGAVGVGGSNTAYAGETTPTTAAGGTGTPGAGGGTGTPAAGATTPAGGATTPAGAATTPAGGAGAGTPTAAGLPTTGTGGSDSAGTMWLIGAGALLAALGAGMAMTGAARRR